MDVAPHLEGAGEPRGTALVLSARRERFWPSGNSGSTSQPEPARYSKEPACQKWQVGLRLQC